MRTGALLIQQDWPNPIDGPAVIRTPWSLPAYSIRELQGIEQGFGGEKPGEVANAWVGRSGSRKSNWLCVIRRDRFNMA